jgi:protein gp37
MTKTSIEWTDETWNPATGCDKVSPGCDNCYAEGIANRFAGTPQFPNGFGVTLRPERLRQPLKWRKPRRVFVNSMSDLFHKDIPDSFIAQVFTVMATAGQHTFQVLTKRPGRMRALMSSAEFQQDVRDFADATGRNGWDESWPLPNVWLGVSAEDQKWADVRIPALIDTPAAVRFVSAEPLLGPIDLFGDVERPGPAIVRTGVSQPTDYGTGVEYDWDDQPGIDWVIVGGESGPKARPMHPDWARSLRDQCTTAGVAYLFKQWGEWMPNGCWREGSGRPPVTVREHAFTDGGRNGFLPLVARVGKKAAGRELDGRTWDEFPDLPKEVP